MRCVDRTPANRRRAVASAILAIGFAAAAIIFLTAGAWGENPLGNPEDSKVYLREMQMVGGTSNVLAYEIRQWLAWLFHGRPLALTVALLTLVICLVYLIQTTPVDPGAGPAKPGGR